MPFKTEARKGDLSGNNASSVFSILQKIRNVNRNNNVDSEYISVAEKYRDGTATEEEAEQLRDMVEQAAEKARYIPVVEDKKIAAERTRSPRGSTLQRLLN